MTHKYLRYISSIILAAIIITSLSYSQKSGTELSEEEAIELVNAHNKWRTDVGVDSIKWSPELAKEAQAWAEKLAKKGCKMNHSNTKNGENIFWSSYESSATLAVDNWGSEKKDYKGEKISGSNYHKFGHYTQMVWHNTQFVGGGRARCKNGGVIWVCQYSPAGNVIGEYPYEKKKKTIFRKKN